MKYWLPILFIFISACSNNDPAVINPSTAQPDQVARDLKVSNDSCESPDPDVEIDLDCIEKQLKGDGIGGWVHAAVHDEQMFVFTWRRPGNFFVNIQLPMSSKDPAIIQRLLKLERHDQIILKGEFFKNDAPLKHINVTELKMVKEYTGPSEPYQYDPTLPAEIMNGTSLIAKVHIVANGGAVLVVETGDRVIPVFNPKPELVRDLFRNDKIEIQYRVRIFPQRPSHLELDVLAAEPVRVMEEIAEGHGEEFTMTGALVMFPQSPQIKFNVFALRQEDADGISRNFTIVNFQNIDLFLKIREELQKAWDSAPQSATYDRNKYINRKIQVTVKGVKNLVAPDQANPQIMPEKFEDVEIRFL